MEQLQRDLEGLFERLRNSALREADMIELAEVRMDGDPSWVAHDR